MCVWVCACVCGCVCVGEREIQYIIYVDYGVVSNHELSCTDRKPAVTHVQRTVEAGDCNSVG